MVMMPQGSGRIIVEASADARRGWLVIRLEVVGLSFDASLVFFPESRMSQDVIDFLKLYQLVTDLGHGRYAVRGLTLGGVVLPSLEVIATAQLGRVQLDGILGVNFLNQFTEVHLNPSSFQLTFVDP